MWKIIRSNETFIQIKNIVRLLLIEFCFDSSVFYKHTHDITVRKFSLIALDNDSLACHVRTTTTTENQLFSAPCYAFIIFCSFIIIDLLLLLPCYV